MGKIPPETTRNKFSLCNGTEICLNDTYKTDMWHFWVYIFRAKIKVFDWKAKGIISKKSLKNPLHLFIRHLFHLFIWESISRLAFFKFYSTSVSKFMVIFITYLHIYIPHIFCSFMHFVHRYGLSIRQLKYVCREILLNTQQMKLQNKAI